MQVDYGEIDIYIHVIRYEYTWYKIWSKGTNHDYSHEPLARFMKMSNPQNCQKNNNYVW